MKLFLPTTTLLLAPAFIWAQSDSVPSSAPDAAGGEGDTAGGEGGAASGKDDLTAGLENALVDVFGGGDDGTPCALCPEGLEVAADTVVPHFGDDGQEETCEQVVAEAPSVAAGSMICESVLFMATPVCCPSQTVAVEDPCPMCPDGLEVPADTVLGDEGETCEQGLEMVKAISADSPMCLPYQREVTETCCPSQAATLGAYWNEGFGLEDLTAGLEDALGAVFGGGDDDTPCVLCPEGLEVADDTVVPLSGDEGQEETCAQAVEGVGSFAAGSPFCESFLLLATATCCPSQPVVAEDPCPVCPEGLEVPADTVVGDEGDGESTCEQGLKMAGSISADSLMCPPYQRAVTKTCCPSKAATLAGNGDGLGDLLGSPGGDGGGLEDLAAGLEDALGAVFGNGTGAACEVCPAGFEVPDDTVVSDLGAGAGEEATCAQTLEMVALFGGDAAVCESYRAMVSATCCPAQAVVPDDPCLPCPDGLGVAEDTMVEVEGSEATCKQTLDFMGGLSADSFVCQMAKVETASVCCPSTAAEENEVLASPAPDADASAPEDEVLAPPAPDADASAPEDEKKETTATAEDAANATASGDDESSPASEPDVKDAEEPDSGAAAVGWLEAAVPTVVTAMLVLFA